MISLNDDSIYIGQIKQILHNFNLPLCQIGDKYPAKNSHFIKQNQILRWDSNRNVKICGPYIYGKQYDNLTGNLKIRNLIYDRDTHRYLGKYLRFLRDYSGLNLMSMYNCFDKDPNVDDIEFSYEIVSGESKEVKTVSFTNKPGSEYVIYQVPISMSDLTICTHNNVPVELCLTITNKNEQWKSDIKKLAQASYKKIKFNDIYIYKTEDIVKNSSVIQFVYDHVSEIELLIKIPASLNSSVVVLEGVYQSSLNKKGISFFGYKPQLLVEDKTDVDINLETKNGKDLSTINNELLLVNGTDKNPPVLTAKFPRFVGFNITSQLLSIENTSGNFLLGDRLIEYLSGNAITGSSEYYEIKRVQKYLDKIRNYQDNKNITKNVPESRYYGKWNESDSNDLKCLIYKYGLNNEYDSIGYLDKDLEKIIRGDLDDVKL